MKSLNVVIVEDEALNVLYLKSILLRIGHKVSGIFVSAKKLLDEINNLSPDLILMDIFLNGEMTGIEAVKEIHKKKSIPIIYITASTDKKTFSRACETTMLGYIKKPFSEEQLTALIDKLI